MCSLLSIDTLLPFHTTMEFFFFLIVVERDISISFICINEAQKYSTSIVLRRIAEIIAGTTFVVAFVSVYHMWQVAAQLHLPCIAPIALHLVNKYLSIPYVKLTIDLATAICRREWKV